MNPWLLALAACLAVSRPNVARVRLSVWAADNARSRAGDATEAVPRWRERGTGVLQSAHTHPYRTATAAAVVASLALLAGGLRLPIGLAVGLVTAATVNAGLGRVRGRRARRDDTAMLNALGVLEAELVAGAREDVALRAAAPLAGRNAALLREAAAVTGYGQETALVLGRGELTRPLASAWRVRHSCGAPLAEVIAQVARDVELRRARAAAVDTALAGPRSSSALLTGLPLVGVALGVAMGAHPGHFLLGTPAGSLVLLVGVGLDVVGWLWTEAMVRRARR